MLLGEYLNNNDIIDIEKNLTKDNFNDSFFKVFEILFGENFHPGFFSGYKFFDKYPFNRIDLYEKGLYPFRYIFSRHASILRMPGIDGFDDGIGIFKYENFLDEDTVEKIKNEIVKIGISENKQPFNKINMLDKEEFPNIVNFYYDQDIVYKLLCKAIRRKPSNQNAWNFFIENSFVQRLPSRPNDGDIQKRYHSDVFFPCIKFWYFPWEVKISDGPFHYTKYSSQPTKEILDFFTRESIAVANGTWNKQRNKGHGEGSFRIFKEELDEMNLFMEPQPVKENTLVFANVSGFHCRGEVSQLHIRNALHGTIRLDDCFTVNE